MMLTKVLSCCALLSVQTALAFSPSITKSRTSSAALYSTSSDGKESVVDGRREFLSSSVATLVAGCLTLSTPLTANAKVKSVDYKAVAKDIASIIKSDPDKGPTLVRLVSISESFCECPNTSLHDHVLTYYMMYNCFSDEQAWHSSGTYDKMSKDGGSGGGTIRFVSRGVVSLFIMIYQKELTLIAPLLQKEELAHGGNAGLGSTAVVWMEAIKKKHPSISYADLYTLGGGKSILMT